MGEIPVSKINGNTDSSVRPPFHFRGVKVTQRWLHVVQVGLMKSVSSPFMRSSVGALGEMISYFLRIWSAETNKKEWSAGSHCHIIIWVRGDEVIGKVSKQDLLGICLISRLLRV